ncbi:aminotransferase class V-fold PLP-dependent enzyme [Chitinophaga sp. S165]|uniref:aminotransferase class V-fold PLP-dependent enzyme n=1 Tax=Chitinophaga sp. S165 TaxID=2135462 RepID=UPI000D717E69|nr:aminotransferase class V-fold PLP-dependent enzyme [Chitinophaga sp. S165]PWV56287.1 selenocysteine lyase/cysteine desulfurase [Chitinophaga sp. S165]
MDIAQIRKDTIGCENIIHFNNAGAALMPASVANTIRAWLTEEELSGGYEVADKRKGDLDNFYEAAASLLHCKSQNIAFTTNATDSYNRALSAIPFKQGDVILTSENDYPSNFIAFISLQKRYGVKVVTVRNAPSGEIDLDDLEKKLLTYKPRLVSVTHVPTSSGLVQPVVAIGEIIKRHDTIYLLDACQSLGQMDVDAVATHADFISGTLRKFLRGPRGAGLLYVSDKALALGLEPLFIDLRGAEWTSKDTYQSLPDAKRFEDWETAYALMAGSTEAIRYLLSLGIGNVQSRNELLSGILRSELNEIGKIQLQDKGSAKCNIITFSMQGHDPESVKRDFRRAGINIYTTSKTSAQMDFLEKGIEWAVRVSPHYYNTEAEIDRFIETLKAYV